MSLKFVPLYSSDFHNPNRQLRRQKNETDNVRIEEQKFDKEQNLT